MNVLVTGATGGIGRTLVPLLAERGARVVATGRNVAAGRALAGADVHFVPADLVRDELGPLLRGVSVVVHLAARSSPWGAPVDFEADNVRATSRLLEAAADAGVARFVHASTPAIFAERRHRLGLHALSPIAARPVNHYARTKLEAERVVRRERRMGTVILRPSAVIGPDDRAIMPRLLRVLSRGVFPIGHDGTALFHPTDVRDAAAAFAVAALGSMTGTVNVAGREPVRVIDLARSLADRLGLRFKTRHVPEPLLHAIATAAEGWGVVSRREPPLTRYSVSILSWSRTFDLAGTEALLGWRPAYAAEDALAHAVPR